MSDELIRLRREKIETLRAQGVNPYPYRYRTTHSCAQVHEGFDRLAESKEEVTVAGRIMLMRVMGKATFLTVEDRDARLQFYIRKDHVGDDAYAIVKKQLDIGDFVGARGTVFTTRTGEQSLDVTGIDLLCKSLKPLPEKYHGLVDKEIRYRRREVDLVMNADVRRTFVTRSRIIAAVRDFMRSRGFLEVETPLIQFVYGGAEARPFVTHINALDVDAFLSISPELYLKRYIVGGMERVFTIAKNFRNEGIDRTHNPEFTMMESYQALADYNDVMDLTEDLFVHVLTEVAGDTTVTFQGRTADFKKPWRRWPIYDAVSEKAGVDVRAMSREALVDWIDAQRFDEPIDRTLEKGYLVLELFDRLVEPAIVEPVFVTDYPAETSPLCKAHREDPELIERFELFAFGTEMGNAYSELNDPVRQRELLEAQATKLRAGLDTASPMDEDFVEAIEVGMPPTGGLGVGIDRLVMLLTDNTSIRDVIAFPFMKPTGATAEEHRVETATAEAAEAEAHEAAKAEPETPKPAATPSSQAEPAESGPLSPPADEPAFGIDRAHAEALFAEWVTSDRLRTHSLEAAAIMRRLAEHFNTNAEAWELAGLLHDLDFDREQTPEKHGLQTIETLESEGVDPYYLAPIKRHNEELGEPRRTFIDHALAASESIAGLVHAAALILPDKKVAGLKPKSVVKRMKKKDFARAVSRENIMECERLGLGIAEFAALAVEAVRGVSEEVGL